MAIDQSTLGAAIKMVRTARGLTQAELAERIGYSSGGLALIEQGRRSVPMPTLNALAEALELPPACLAILGSRSEGQSRAVARFMESLKRLVSTLVVAKTELRAKQNAENAGKKAMQSTYHRLSEATQMFEKLATDPKVTMPKTSGRRVAALG